MNFHEFSQLSAAHLAAQPAVRPFAASISPDALHDLERRLEMVRWPDPGPVNDWSQGVPVKRLRRLVERWRHGYSWARAEAKLNALPQFVTAIDGVDIHFIHVRSPHDDALPIMLTHGSPGSVFEFLDAVAALTDPMAYGGTAGQAFHVVIASLPGYGFSAQPSEGWGTGRVAAAWSTLMARLGYTNWVAHGGGLGAEVTARLAAQQAPGLAAIHMIAPPIAAPTLDPQGDPLEHAEALAYHAATADQFAYLKLQQTRPQTLGYALADSPLAQAAWMYEKLCAWSGYTCIAEPPRMRDAFLDSISLYWLTGTGAGAARIYAESAGAGLATSSIKVPVAIVSYPREPARIARRWAEDNYPTLHCWSEAAAGGQCPALEDPMYFAAELRHAFTTIR
jgi:pimeloyl-ACP methyl ester carboxylesterase